MTPTIATLLAALSFCATDTQCESIAADLCSEGMERFCETLESPGGN